MVLFLCFGESFRRKIVVSEMHLYLDYGVTLQKQWREEMVSIVRNGIFG